MESILEKKIVIALNGAWQAIGYRTVGEAITRMNGGAFGGKPPALALDITLDEQGKLVSAVPTTWEEWVKLPVRDGDLTIGTKDGLIRCPTVILAPSFMKMPCKLPSFTTHGVLERDGFICGYTNRKLTRKEATVDHIIPRSRGGENTWENTICCEKGLNHKKGSSLNHEIGLTLTAKPKAPKSVPVSVFVKEIKHATHRPFILSKES